LLLVALVTVLAVTAPACGKFSRSSGAKTTTSTGEYSVGEGLGIVTTPTRQPGATVVTQAPSDDATPTGEALNPNQSRYDTPEGFRMTLTVEGSLKYKPGDLIDMHVLVQNISKHDLQFDPNDLKNFAFRSVGTSQTAWTDGNCRADRVPKALETSAQTLHPREESEFRDTYPGPADFANRDECRVPNGTYAVFGFVAWCPPGSTDAKGVCDPARTVQLSSAGVRITIG
jgi:hypothetical protein